MVFLCFFYVVVINLLRRAVLSLTAGFFMGFHVGVSNGKADLIESSY